MADISYLDFSDELYMNNIIAGQNNVLILKVALKLSDFFDTTNCLKIVKYGKPDRSFRPAPGALNSLPGNVDLAAGTVIIVYALGVDRDETASFYPDVFASVGFVLTDGGGFILTDGQGNDLTP